MFDQPIWIGSPHDVRAGDEATAALAAANDSRFAGPDGIAAVDHARWLLAQEYERATWMEACLGAQSDRNHEHLAGFGGYAALPEALGDALEAGCGPFTQLATVLGTGRRAASITLADPLANAYLGHPNCQYKYGMLCGQYASVISRPMEDMAGHGGFDFALCVNVLEHVRDAPAAMANLLRMLRPGGYLAFHERSWELTDPARLYDAGHPIRLSYRAIRGMLAGLAPLYDAVSEHEGGKSLYFIGRKA